MLATWFKSHGGKSEIKDPNLVFSQICLKEIFFYLPFRRHWLFGEKILNAKSKHGENGTSEKPNLNRIRGWFPRKCAVELVDPESDDEHEHFTAKKTN